MGASSSKATRSLPKRVTTPPWSGARAPRAVDSLTEAASETKNDVIQQDSKDPQFLSKLSQLGPVRVDHHMQTVRTAELAKQMFDSRVQSENQATASAPTQNRLQAPKLATLLDERKSIRTARDMEFLAQRFGVDLEQLDAISKFVNTPSVQANSAVRVTSKDGQEKQTIKAVWIEPRLKTSQSP
ncbi:hypothetical protein DFH08DRAFT_873334 [Mycena albidolilacea]|uniref:Uncharacterized protein n=1 Tax=Mycena albidolilacea TaxID=1033008 RepID=A0AAD6ZXW2_9AGAR|nr:hypothetical protein DFH08DRAFT_873334 [Mycena albidolilacea]